MKAELQPTVVGDYDKDNIPDRMVKFDRQKVINLLQALELPLDVELRVVGNLKDGTPFAGSDIIKVIKPGKGGTQNEDMVIDIPKTFSFSVSPNPFVKQTCMRYGVPKPTYVSLQIYDVSGRLVLTLVAEENKPGYYTISFDNKDLTPGLYFLKFIAGEFKATRKLILVK